MTRRAARHPHVFRAMLALALLAWSSLAFGAALAPRASGMAMAMSMAPAAAPAVGHAPDPAAPAAPACCHGGCHCLGACNAILGVPYLLAAAPVPARLRASARPMRAASVRAAPPLRPPIA